MLFKNTLCVTTKTRALTVLYIVKAITRRSTEEKIYTEIHRETITKFNLCGSLCLLCVSLCNFLIDIYTNFDRKKITRSYTEKKNFTEIHRETIMKYKLSGSQCLLGGTLCNFLIDIYTNFDRKKITLRYAEKII
jgi:hypothetical protein